MKTKTILSYLFIGAASLANAAVVINDDFSADTLANYTTTPGRAQFAYDGTNDRVNNPVSGNTVAIMTHESSVGQFTANSTTVTMAFDFLKASDATDTASNNGVLSLSDGLSYLGSPTNGFDVTAKGNGVGTGFLRLRMNDSSTGQLSSSTFAFTGNTWYTMNLTVAQAASASDFSVSASIALRDTPFTTLATIATTTVTNTQITDLEALYAGFGVGISTLTDGRGGIAADNFKVDFIPEPSSVMLLGLASLGLARRRRH